MTSDIAGAGIFKFTKRQWTAALILFVAFIAAMRISSALFPAPAILFLGSGIALSILFLEGAVLWPIVFLASLTGQILNGSALVFMLTIPVAHTLQAWLGASVLRNAKIDPLFRSLRQMLIFIGVLLIVATIVPSIGSIAIYLNTILGGMPVAERSWAGWYTANVFSLLIIAPFIMRWFAKPRFGRSVMEIAETSAVFALLIGISYFLFFTDHNQIGGVSLVYALLLPFFWIALRLRPRFVTLALVVTASLGVASLFVGTHVPTSELFSERLFQMELFLIIIAGIFYVLVALEEDRRVTTNVMRSQVVTLENAVMRISSESQAKNDFIAVLAHELRNPLAPVASAIDFLKLKGPREAEETEALRIMEDRMTTVKRLLDDLLDASRISERKVTLEKEPVALVDVVNRATSSTTHYFHDRHQTLAVDLPKEPIVIDGDPVRVEQMLTNLLANASKYSVTGDRISLSARAVGSEAEVRVKDNGIGIASDMLESIFEPFRQLGTGDRGKHGLGIGLALVRSFAEMHGGSIRAASDGKNKGSEFILRLPLSTEEPTSRPAEIKITKKPTSVPTSSGRQVLIVDDNDAAALGVGKLLELKGYTVAYAYDGDQGIEQATSLSPDIVFLDIGLPDIDGYQVAKMLRGRGYTGTLVALTGYSLEEDRKRGSEVGFDHFLIKPIGLAELKQVIPELS